MKQRITNILFKCWVVLCIASGICAVIPYAVYKLLTLRFE